MKHACAQAAADLCAGLRGELPPGRADALRSHLAACPACAGDERAARELSALLSVLPLPSPAPGAFDRLRARIEAGETSPAASRSTLRRLLPAAAAAAAAILVLAVLLTRPPGGALLGERTPPTAAGLTTARFTGDRTVRLTLSPDARVAAEGPSRLFVSAGRVLGAVEPGATEMVFATPDAEVLVRGTTLLLDVGDRTTTVAVVEGKVEVRTDAGSVRLDSGTTLTVARGRVVRGPEPADPWRMRDWCSAPAVRLLADGDALVLVLANETPEPLAVERFDPARAAYSLLIPGPDGSLPVVVRGPMVRSGARGPGDSLYRTLAPGEEYRFAIALDGLDLPPGEHEVRAVYQPYRDPPPEVWRGTRESNPARIRRP